MLTVWFVVLAILAEGPNTLQIDIEVSAWVQGFDSPFAEWLAEFGDIVGGSIFAIAMLIVGLAVMGWLKRRRELIAAGRSSIRVGHVDLLARPIATR